MSRLGRIKLFNLVLSQGGWLVCVVGAAKGYPLAGPLAVFAALVLHLSWAARPVLEMKLLAACAAIGLLFDALLLASGWVTFPGGWWLPGLAPYWMMCMWLLFGTTLNLSLSWLRARPVLAALFGAVGGPLAYLAGARLGGIDLLQATPAVIALAVGWGTIMPLLGLLATRLDGFASRGLPDYICKDFTAGGVPRNV